MSINVKLASILPCEVNAGSRKESAVSARVESALSTCFESNIAGDVSNVVETMLLSVVSGSVRKCKSAPYSSSIFSIEMSSKSPTLLLLGLSI